MSNWVVAVDVGTGSARAGLFDTTTGHMAARAERKIALFNDKADFYEHSSVDIWDAVCEAVRECVGTRGSLVKGISFDATCSLVALDAHDRPVSLSPTPGSDDDGKAVVRNVIVWMDHRAIVETDAINKTQHAALKYVGGVMSPEMEPPKLLWIKKHLPHAWERTAHFFDLADFLVYSACGVAVRSSCTLVCKWGGYRAHEQRWDQTFFEQVGLADLVPSGRAGSAVAVAGTRAGALTAESAKRMGLTTAVAVGVGIIDAHAGGLGTLAFKGGQVTETLAVIGGTSTCHMATSAEAMFVHGVWGPYFGAMVPGYWLLEGGQTASGLLLDHVVRSHPAHAALLAQAQAQNKSIYTLLNERVHALGGRPQLTEHFHVLPDFHGNRSPVADPELRGSAVGLTLHDGNEEGLVLRYYATLQALCYGTRHVMEAIGKPFTRVHACGGLTKNELWLQEHADITGCQVWVSADDTDAVLLGTAMLASVAAGVFASVEEALKGFVAPARKLEPRREFAAYHSAKMAVLKRMQADQVAYRALMSAASK